MAGRGAAASKFRVHLCTGGSRPGWDAWGLQGQQRPQQCVGLQPRSENGMHPNSCRHKEGKQLPCLCWPWYRSSCGLQALWGQRRPQPKYWMDPCFMGSDAYMFRALL